MPKSFRNSQSDSSINYPDEADWEDFHQYVTGLGSGITPFTKEEQCRLAETGSIQC
jgi:hypothetical protein